MEASFLATGYILESKSTDKIIEVIEKIRNEIPTITHNKTAVGKTRAGRDIEYSYTNLPRLLEILNPLFIKHRVLFDTMQIANGYIVNKLIDIDSKQFIGSIHKVYDIEKDYPHHRASAITISRRLFLYGKFGLHPAEDDDGNSAEGNFVRESHGEFRSEQVKKQLSSMHEKHQDVLKNYALPIKDEGEDEVTTPKIISIPEHPRTEKQVALLKDNFESFETLIKWDGRRYKSYEQFLGKAPKSIILGVVGKAIKENHKLNSNK